MGLFGAFNYRWRDSYRVVEHFVQELNPCCAVLGEVVEEVSADDSDGYCCIRGVVALKCNGTVAGLWGLGLGGLSLERYLD